MSAALANLTLEQLAQIPAGIPPPGHTSNLVNPHSEGHILIAVGGFLVGAMFVFLFMRLFVKLKIQRKITLDDWTTMIAVIGTCLYYGICVYGVTKAKFATHMWDISIAHTMSDEFLVCSFFLNWPTALVWAFAKTSFFLMYLDLFRPIKWLRFGCYIGLIVNWGFYTAVIVASIYYNVPNPGQTWLEGSRNARYTRSFEWTIPIASGSLILDSYIFALPIWVVWKLHLDLRKRIGVIAVFATGLMACVASSLSIVYKHKLSGHLADFTYWTYPILLMAIVEMCVGISCSCMPASAAFWRYLRKDSPRAHRKFLESAFFVPILSLFQSGSRSGAQSNDSTDSWKKDSNKILKSNHIHVQLDSESTRGLAFEHELTEFSEEAARNS